MPLKSSTTTIRRIRTSTRVGESPKEIAEDLIDERGDGGVPEPDEEIEGGASTPGGEIEDP